VTLMVASSASRDSAASAAQVARGQARVPPPGRSGTQRNMWRMLISDAYARSVWRLCTQTSASAHSRAGETCTPVSSTSGMATGDASGVRRERAELSFLQHMTAGALAGTVEHIAMFPMDTVKTRMQALPHGGASISHDLNYSTVRAALRTVLRLEGVRGLYRGVDAMALGAGPAHALYFATYEAVKRVLGGADEPGSHPGVTAIAGATATIVNDAVLTPLDTVKQRLQIANSPYTSLFNCASRMFRDEGLNSFFRSCALFVLLSLFAHPDHSHAY
jgi:Mitochondrial carrier protein